MTLRDLPGRKDSNDSLGRRRRGAASAFSGYGADSTGRGNSSKVTLPMGDPVELRIHSYELTLRLADAEKIEIENIRDAGQVKPGKKRTNSNPPSGDLERVVNIMRRKQNILCRIQRC